MIVVKKFRETELELSYSPSKQGCRVQIKARNPRLLFSIVGDDLPKLQAELEMVCDDWMEELEKNIHTSINILLSSFTAESIYLTREYTF